MYLASSSNYQFRPSLESAQESGYPHTSAFKVHFRVPVISPGLPARDDDGEIMVWIISAEIQVVLVGSPGIIDFMDPAVYISYIPYMVIGIVRWDRYNPVSDWIIPVPEFGIHKPVIMVHTVSPGNMDPVRYMVMVIYLTIPYGIVMIAFYMICTYCSPVGSCILLAMLGICPCNMLPAACIATDGLIIPIVSSCCTLVRRWLLSLVCTGITPVRGSVSLATASIASVATRYLALPRLFVGAY